MNVWTYSDQDAMQVPGFVSVAGFLQQLSEPPHSRHSQDVEVIVVAESLQQFEVNLQRSVIFILLIKGQHTQHRAIRVSAGRTGE